MIDLQRVAQRVADHCGITLGVLLGRRRTRSIAAARQLFYYIAYHLTRHSYPSIGRFCDRDHATVMWGVKRHAGRLAGVR